MKSIYFLAFIFISQNIFLSGCSNRTVTDNISKTTEPASNEFFKIISNYPQINDSIVVIEKILNYINVGNSVEDLMFNGSISKFIKFNIYGSNEELYLLEYEIKDGPSVLYPFKWQIIVNSSGKPLTSMSAIKFDLYNFDRGNRIYLHTIEGTSRGNGNHGLYHMKNDSICNSLVMVKNSPLRTFDADDNGFTNIPSELNLRNIDFNEDGFQDLEIFGELGYLDKIIPITFQFQYIDTSDDFVQVNNINEILNKIGYR